MVMSRGKREETDNVYRPYGHGKDALLVNREVLW